MRKNNNRRKKNTGAPYFIILSAVLVLAAVFFGIRAMNTMNVYNAQAEITPTPSPTVSIVRATAEPRALTDAPIITATPAPQPTDNLLRSGSTGEAVISLQQRLKELGYYSGNVDGQFGNGTKAAVLWFQRQHKLSDDGIVGDATKQALYAQTAQQAVTTPTPQPIDVLPEDVPLLVNRENALPDGFYPANLVKLKDVLPEGLATYKIEGLQGVAEAVDALSTMLTAAHADGLTVWQFSEGYRTEDRQKQIFNNSVSKYMADGQSRSQATSSTRLTVADPGQSEHQTGLAFDITVPGKYFSDTAQYAWLAKHCWEYGFILRYTDEKQDITGFLGEEWHYRYVGVEHSLRIRDLGICLEEYIQYIKN